MFKQTLSAMLIAGVVGGATIPAAAPTGWCAEKEKAAGIPGGLVVHLGCGDGTLTAALRANDSFLVHGLDTDARNVEAARKHIRSLGLYGKVSVEQFDGKRLPYVDNLVNLIVTSGECQVAGEEIMRVLAPGGVALVGGRKIVKPRPANTDEWTHFLHDASGNPVARDTVVGPPRHVQWVEDPRHARSHEHTPSVAAVVSNGGRVFYIVDEGPAGSIREPARWHVVARDAYNGVRLWKQPVAAWWPHLCGWTSGPRQLQRKLVAAGGCVYVTLGLHAPLTALDAATGRTLRVYDGTLGAEEIVWHDGTLLLAVRTVTEERKAQLEKWARLSKQERSPLDDRDTAAPLLKALRDADENAPMTLMALDAATGKLLWKQTPADRLKPLTLSALGNKVFCQQGRETVCLDLKDGRKRWSARAQMRVASARGVICADGGTASALSLETGTALWTQETLLCDVKDAFVIGGSVWLGGFKPWQGRKDGKRGPAWGAYFLTECDAATGKRLRHLEPENPGHHHRCYPNKATERFILGGRRGTEFIDLKSGEVLWHSWARGVCMYGVMPANGLFYVPPHACGCYIAAKLTGFYALAAERGGVEREAPGVERGAGGMADGQPPIAGGDWPTYRGDAARSAMNRTAVPARLKRVWQADVGGKLTAPTVAGGRVFVASEDVHRVCALDADSGRAVWDFTAGGRVDTPPTLCGGLAVFGSRDGWLYGVRAGDGVMAWRLRAAREDRRIVARGQLEAASPLHGGVLVEDGVAFVTAGRSSYLDGGIDLCRVEVASGKLLSRTPIYSPDPKTGRQPPQEGPGNMPGALNDILVSDGQRVYLRELAFDKNGRRQDDAKPHLLTLTGFLDDTWAHRSDWIFGTRCSLPTGCTRREKDTIVGRLMAFNDATLYGYGRQTVQWSNQLQDGRYRLFALNRADGAARWEKAVPIQVRAMVLAGGTLFVAGPSLLLAISAADGAELGRCALDAEPVFDGMAAAGGRLFVSTTKGALLCCGAK